MKHTPAHLNDLSNFENALRLFLTKDIVVEYNIDQLYNQLLLLKDCILDTMHLKDLLMMQKA